MSERDADAIGRIEPAKRAVPAKGGARMPLAAPRARADEAPRPPRLWGPVVAGLVLVVVGFGGFVGWASTAELASASLAPGVVAVESKRRTVEHLEGGYVRELLVREGDRVEAGEVLVRIDATQDSARRARLDSRLLALVAERDRLRAVLDGAEEIAFSEELSARAEDPQVAAAIGLQRRVHAERLRERDRAVAIAESAIAEAREEIVGIDAQLEAREAALAFLVEREAGLAELLEKGYATPVQVNEVRAEIANARAAISELKARRTAAEERIRQRLTERENAEVEPMVAASDRLQAVEREINEVRESLLAAEDTVRRTDVLAPISGTVVGLAVTTEGAVVDAGETLMEIVPERDRLVIDAMIRPEDIDVVYPGLPVDVRLTAYSFRSTPPVSGTLVQVSADRVVDGRTGAAVYRGVVELDPGSLAALGEDAALYPGMPAEVMIRTGERTLMAYLLDPLMSAMNRSMREQ